MLRCIVFCTCFLGFLGMTSSFPGSVSAGQADNEPKRIVPPSVTESPSSRLLVFSKTAGFRHSSIAAGIQCLTELGTALGFEVVATEDSSIFTEEGLDGVAVVVFLNTTGDILDSAQQAAFESWFRAGGGWLGVHAAADTEYDWPFYAELVGAYFKSHPRIQPAVVVVEDSAHPSTRMLPGLWRRQDEWYTYRMNPRPHVKVLATVDESTFEGGGMSGDHPIAWCHEALGGRSLYTGGGHTVESYVEPAFREHLRGSLRWVGHLPDSNEELSTKKAPAIDQVTD